MRIGLVIVIIVSLLPLWGLLHSGLPITHDGADHVARIASFYRSLSEGIVIPRWAELLNWGYGHPILMFLYPFSSYTASLFHFIGFSFVDSLKIIFGMGFVASGVTMYLWAREQFDENIGVAAAFLYLFAPYRFVDLYVRGAIGEHMAFIFPPLVLFFMQRYFRSKKNKGEYLYLVGLAVSFALLLLAHNAISLMFIPVFAAYGIYLFYTSKNITKLILAAAFFVLGLLLSGFFTFPAFFEGKYTLRDIVTGDEYKTRFVDNPLKFIYGEWNYGITGQFSVQLGIPHIIGSLILLFLLFTKKIKKEMKVVLIILYAILLFSLFIQLSISNFLYEIVTTFKKFQFPWRFLSLSLFAASVLAASSLFIINKRHRKWAVSVLLIVLLVTTFPYWKAKGYKDYPDVLYDRAYQGTTDTGESAPIWSVRFMEKEPVSEIEVITGNADIKKLSRTSTKHTYHMNVSTDSVRIRENTLYFPGWSVYVDGQPVDIQFQDPSERGLITFNVPYGEHLVEVRFEETKLRFISNVASIVTFFVLTAFSIYILVRSKNDNNTH